MVASAMQGLMSVKARAMFQAQLPGVDVHRRTEHRRAGLLCKPQLLARILAGQPFAVILQLAVHAQHEFARHAQLDAHVRILVAHDLGRLQGRLELGVAGSAGGIPVEAIGACLPHRIRQPDHVPDSHLDGFFLGGTSLLNAGLRQAARSSSRRVRPVWSRAPGWA